MLGKLAADEAATRTETDVGCSTTRCLIVASEQQQQLQKHFAAAGNGSVPAGAVQQLAAAQQQFVAAVAAAMKGPGATARAPGEGGAEAMDVDVPAVLQQQSGKGAGSAAGAADDEEEVIVFEPRQARLSSPASDDGPQAAAATAAAPAAAPGCQPKPARSPLPPAVAAAAAAEPPPLPQQLLASRQQAGRPPGGASPASGSAGSLGQQHINVQTGGTSSPMVSSPVGHSRAARQPQLLRQLTPAAAVAAVNVGGAGIASAIADVPSTDMAAVAEAPRLSASTNKGIAVVKPAVAVGGAATGLLHGQAATALDLQLSTGC